MSLIVNPYLEESSSKVRSKPIPWEGYQRAGLITPAELAAIKKVDRQPRSRIESILVNEGAQYAALYLSLLKKLVRVDVLQYILVLIGDSLIDHEERIGLYTGAAHDDPELPYGPLLRSLDTPDEFVQLKACQVLSILFGSSEDSAGIMDINTFLNFISSLIKDTSIARRDVGVQCLEATLPTPAFRLAVWHVPSIMQSLVQLLKSNKTAQMQYQITFCIWLLSFEPSVAAAINRQYDVIPILTEVAQTAAKEKVIRVVVATFKNLVVKAPDANLPAMLVAKLLPFVQNLTGRKFSDEDIKEDVLFLRDELKAQFESLTTYDEYASELVSGHLGWTPVHDSDEFWKENACRLNENDSEQLKRLVDLLNTSTDPVMLAVAAHDIGKYVKYCERGKKIITDLGAKTRVMELMSHEDSEVRYQALMSVQLLVSHSWAS
ncbi:ATPase V1 complex subunit H [Dacryopinax primogenitus]|uniref:V-type proton ATPase subunit H n=1 Tax=Dacryopinax primogenitus (strain DJM 731) TaxID=1858805 RepID=M5G0S5_DACPD|nr:ATPase V1 complex subunit H [Dacryopinax primogenitus]EJT97397.1 ATPase V1 complex subunit H [Dacryopinax primogenitus]